MRLTGVIVGLLLAIAAGKASAQSCFFDTEVGPYTCNCSATVDMTLTTCSSASVTVKSGNEGGVTGTFPGLTGTAKAWYSTEATTSGSECGEVEIPPLHCAWWEYHFEVCISWRLQEGFLWDTWVKCVDAKFLGKNHFCEPMPLVACK
jgi:hypothetical protein